MNNKSFFLCFSGIFLFSTIEVLGKMISGFFSPFAVTLLRFVIGSFALLPFAFMKIKKENIRLSGRDIILISLPGILNVSISMLFLHLAIFYGKASISAILISSNSIFVAIFSYFILKEKIDNYRIIGIILGVIGIFLVVYKHLFSNTHTQNEFLGIVFGILSTVTFGLYITLSKKFVLKYGNLVYNSISFFIGSIILFLLCILAGFDLTMNITLKSGIIIFVLGFFATGIAYMLFFEGIKKIPAAYASMIFFFKPAIAVVLAYIFLGEQITFIQIVGVVLVFIGVNLKEVRNILFQNKI